MPAAPTASPMHAQSTSSENQLLAQSGWTWLVPYLVIIFALLLLGSLLGDLSLFKRATLGTQKLNASQLIKFLSFGGALFMLWLIAQRGTMQLRIQGGRTGFLGGIVAAVAVLAIVSCSYSVTLIVLKPLLAKSARAAFDWLFVLGISGCALWLVVTLFRNADPLMALFTGPSAQKSLCAKCGQPLAKGAQFCSGCGSVA